jgi:hypothetical protein
MWENVYTLRRKAYIGFWLGDVQWAWLVCLFMITSCHSTPHDTACHKPLAVPLLEHNQHSWDASRHNTPSESGYGSRQTGLASHLKTRGGGS